MVDFSRMDTTPALEEVADADSVVSDVKPVTATVPTLLVAEGVPPETSTSGTCCSSFFFIGNQNFVYATVLQQMLSYLLNQLQFLKPGKLCLLKPITTLIMHQSRTFSVKSFLYVSRSLHDT